MLSIIKEKIRVSIKKDIPKIFSSYKEKIERLNTVFLMYDSENTKYDEILNYNNFIVGEKPSISKK